MQSLFQPLLGINWSLFTTINAPAGQSPFLDQLMPFLAQNLIYGYALLVLLLWWIPGGSSPAARAQRSLSREAVLWAIAAAILALIVNVILGTLIYEPRPFVSAHVHQLIPHAKDASFPSDHTSVSFAIAGVLLIRYFMALRLQPTQPAPRLSAFGSQTAAATVRNSDQPLSAAALAALRWRTGLLAVLGLLAAISIGYARIYVGIHYPGDILGGAMIGLLSAWVVSLAQGMIRPVARLAENGARRLHLA